MKKFLALALALTMSLSLVACGKKETPNVSTPGSTSTSTPEKKVYNVAYVVNGNLGDKSFFDSAEAGLQTLKADGRITLRTIELGGTAEDQPKWLDTLYEVSESKEYDVIEQKYIIFDDNTYAGQNSNVLNITYKQNDMGYLMGIFAAYVTSDTSIDKINEDAVIGFVGGVDSPVINDFLFGFIEGAQSVNPDIKVDTRYTNDYVDTAIAKEFGLSMINDNKCDVIWGVAGNAGNGAAEAALETGKAYFLGVDSDQELTFGPDLAAITLTSGLKNIGNSLVWVFDELDAGSEHWGTEVQLGLAEGGVGIVTDKNFATFASDDCKAAITAAEEAIKAGTLTVDTAIGDTDNKIVGLRDSVRP